MKALFARRQYFFRGVLPVARIAFNMRPRRGPYGGGNQWLNQLSTYLARCGYAVQFHLDERVDCVMGTHAGLGGELSFSYEDVLALKRRNTRLRCIQRINDNDVRKETKEMDMRLASANCAADFTVFVSKWLEDYHADRWFDCSRPHSVIHNGADPAIFHPIGTKPWHGGEVLRIVTHHWADNYRKGFDVYREMDEAIAQGLLKDVELWIVGRWPADIQWKCAKTFPPCAGVKLAALLRQCHAYVTASRYEPGAMHPVEGLQCGLPLLYHPETGGTVELGQRYGVEISGSLSDAVEVLRSNYSQLRTTILAEPPSGDLMCLEYRRLIQRVLSL